MGSHMYWMVCKADSLPEIKSLLRAKDLEEGQEPCFVGNVDGSQLFVFESRRLSGSFEGDRARRRLSMGREMYFCVNETGAMFSECAFWKNGEEIWRVAHLSDDGSYHVDARGQLPPSFEEFKRKRFEEQDVEGGEKCGVDCVFSLPLDLAKEATGFDGEDDWPEGEYFEWDSKYSSWLYRTFENLFRRG